jgi:hypothetical protein
MLDIAVAYNRYKFLGNEFLTWVWYLIENDDSMLKTAASNITSLEIGKRIVLQKQKNDNLLETLTIKGDEVGLEEGMLALKKGAVVTELHLILKSDSQEWHFNLKGESMNISSLKTPETAHLENKEDIEGAILEKIFLYQYITDIIDYLFQKFVHLRTSDQWQREALPNIVKWIVT